MRPLKLAKVRQHTGRHLTYAEAITFYPHDDRFLLRLTALALSARSWNNTTTDWLRLEAALVIIHHRPRRTC